MANKHLTPTESLSVVTGVSSAHEACSCPLATFMPSVSAQVDFPRHLQKALDYHACLQPLSLRVFNNYFPFLIFIPVLEDM